MWNPSSCADVHVDFVFERLESADDHGRLGPFPETQGGFAGSGSHFACPFDVEVHLFLRFAGVVVHDVRFECVPASRVFRPIAGFGDFAGSNGSSVFVAFRGSSVFNVFCDFRGFCGFHWAGMPPNAQVVAWFHFRNIITADTGNAIGAHRCRQSHVERRWRCHARPCRRCARPDGAASSVRRRRSRHVRKPSNR